MWSGWNYNRVLQQHAIFLPNAEWFCFVFALRLKWLFSPRVALFTSLPILQDDKTCKLVSFLGTDLVTSPYFFRFFVLHYANLLLALALVLTNRHESGTVILLPSKCIPQNIELLL